MQDLYDVRESMSSFLAAKQRAEIEMPLTQALNLTLSQDICANFDSPLFTNSAMDGYAIGSLQTQNFKVVGTVFAGDLTELPALQAGEAVRIFTGAKVPAGAAAVVMQEYCQEQDGILTFNTTVHAQDHMRLQGEEFKQGSLLLPAGTTLKAAHIALLAAQNVAQVSVFKPLRVGVLSSGNELKPLGASLELGQIIDSNRLMLISLLQEFGGIEIVDLGIVKDDAATVKEVITKACQEVDALMISGGASVGDADFAVKTVTEIGTLNLHKVAIKPGKPFGLGMVGQTVVFILPGNPVSAFVTYHLLTRYALAQLLNINLTSKLATGTADFDYTSTNKRRQFLRVKLSYQALNPQHVESGQPDTQITAHYIAEQGSGMLSGCTQADALLEVAPMTEIKKGQKVKLYLL